STTSKVISIEKAILLSRSGRRTSCARGGKSWGHRVGGMGGRLGEGADRGRKTLHRRIDQPGANLADACAFGGDASVDLGQDAGLEDQADVDAGGGAAEVQDG